MRYRNRKDRANALLESAAPGLELKDFINAGGARKVAMAKAHDIVGLRKPGFPNNGFDLSNAFVTQSARFG